MHCVTKINCNVRELTKWLAHMLHLGVLPRIVSVVYQFLLLLARTVSQRAVVLDCLACLLLQKCVREGYFIPFIFESTLESIQWQECLLDSSLAMQSWWREFQQVFLAWEGWSYVLCPPLCEWVVQHNSWRKMCFGHAQYEHSSSIHELTRVWDIREQGWCGITEVLLSEHAEEACGVADDDVSMES